MSVLFCFPGQGAQRPGMLDDLPDSAPVAETVACAEDALDQRLVALDTARALSATRAVQILLTVTGVAAARHLIAEAGMPQAVMGLSIGAWPAAVIADAIDFGQAVRLVAERGRLMGEAYPEGYGMLAVLGLSETAVAALVADRQAAGQVVHLANVNTDQQIVVAGTDEAMDALAAAARTQGARATHRLDIAVPSHCALLDFPAARLADAAADTHWQAPTCAYFSANARRRLWQADDIGDDLIYNMARPVYWAQTARIAHESGFPLAVEMPPGATLTGLHPHTDTPGEAIAVQRSGWHNASALIRRAVHRAG